MWNYEYLRSFKFMKTCSRISPDLSSFVFNDTDSVTDDFVNYVDDNGSGYQSPERHSPFHLKTWTYVLIFCSKFNKAFTLIIFSKLSI